MDNRIDMLMDYIEYPGRELLLSGPRDGYNYTYVSNTYLNGFINYVDIICGYMIRRYSIYDNSKWLNQCNNIEALKDSPHTNISDINEFDDIIILAESDTSYWIFWNDCDCSDCCIGKLSKKEFHDAHHPNIDSIKKEFKKYVIACLVTSTGRKFVPDTYDNYLKYIPPEYFRGWIKL